MNLQISAVIVLSLAFVGCASSSPKSDKDEKKANTARAASAKNSAAATTPSVAVTEKQQAKNDLQRIVDKKNHGQGLSLVSNPQNKSAHFSVDPKVASSSSQLYDQMVYQYEIKNWMGFQERLTVMQQKYPRAPEMADALYLAGQLQMAEKNYGRSLQFLSQVQNQFPLSHQMAGVYYSKGAIYRKMNLASLAKSMWAQVIEKYPGSPEAAKAKSELRLIR